MACGLIHFTGSRLVACQRRFIHFGPHRDYSVAWEWRYDNEFGHPITKGEQE